ncbi:MAG: hypothetical protein A3F46_08920 [Legionellales bacterium RIFCSPHIGHO2_12_FULL_42_9]|nr:MAG: hypothetical protein A3F46_08920 [Legionellales bacterium RIFCSPHIGHO2_12_FULL_42_9]
MFPYEKPVDPASVDMDRAILLKAVGLFRHQYSLGAFPGGQMVVRRHGKVVVNESIGVARGYRSGESLKFNVQENTPFPAFSTGKPLAAVVIALLEERGLLDVRDPIVKFIPEFERHDKGNITILDILTHRAGLVSPSLYSEHKHAEQEFVLNLLINAKPMLKYGTFSYMAMEYGILLCEIVRRITGKSLADFFNEEFAIPLSLPALKFGLAGRPIDSLAYAYWLGTKDVSYSLGNEKVIVPSAKVADIYEKSSNPDESFKSVNPAFSLITDAASLAAFYEFLVNNGVTNTGKKILSEKIIHEYTKCSVSGWNKSLKTYASMGRGFVLGSTLPSPYGCYGWWNTKQCFGHAGSFSSVAFGDHKTKLSVAILTNGNQGMFNLAKRFIPISHQLRKACL